MTLISECVSIPTVKKSRSGKGREERIGNIFRPGNVFNSSPLN